MPYQNLEELKAGATELANKVLTATNDAFKNLPAAGQEMAKKYGEYLAAPGNEKVKTLAEWVESLPEESRKQYKSAIESVDNFFKTQAPGFQEFISSAANKAKEGAGGLWETITDFFSKTFHGVGGSLGFLGGGGAGWMTGGAIGQAVLGPVGYYIGAALGAIGAAVGLGTLGSYMDTPAPPVVLDPNAGAKTKPDGTPKPLAVDGPAVDPKTTDPKTTDPKTTDPKTTDPKTTDPKTTDPKTTDPKTTDPKVELGNKIKKIFSENYPDSADNKKVIRDFSTELLQQLPALSDEKKKDLLSDLSYYDIPKVKDAATLIINAFVENESTNLAQLKGAFDKATVAKDPLKDLRFNLITRFERLSDADKESTTFLEEVLPRKSNDDVTLLYVSANAEGKPIMHTFKGHIEDSNFVIDTYLLRNKENGTIKEMQKPTRFALKEYEKLDIDGLKDSKEFKDMVKQLNKLEKSLGSSEDPYEYTLNTQVPTMPLKGKVDPLGPQRGNGATPT